MESILLNSPALKKVLRHSIDTDDIERLHEFADKLKKEALRLATEFGYFRLLNHIKDFGLKCNAIGLEEAIDTDTLELDRELVASKLAGDKLGITGEQLLQETDELRQKHPPDNLQLCRGKDVVAIMAYILPILFKSQFGDDLSQSTRMAFHDKELSKDLRMAYEYGYFTETSLFNCIRNWESENSPYRIIKN